MISRLMMLAALVAGLGGAYIFGGLTLRASFASSVLGSTEAQCDAETNDDGPAASALIYTSQFQVRTAPMPRYPGGNISRAELETADRSPPNGVELVDRSGDGWEVRVRAVDATMVSSQPETVNDPCD